MTVEEYFDSELSYTIWNNKYRHNNESFEEWLDRISDKNYDLKKLILEKKFMFGGRILSNYNTGNNKTTYSNCYVLSPPEDNLESIFEVAGKLARTYSYGGGVGINISKLAPKGAKVNNAAKTTSGSTSFMGLFSYVTGLIAQNGRRGALMLSLECTHPDLIDFINIKSNLEEVTKANISVMISDEFMRAVLENKDWELSFTRDTGETISKTVKAKEILQLLAKRNWEMAEPGILYWDRVKNYNMLQYNKEFEYKGVNPCRPVCMA